MRSLVFEGVEVLIRQKYYYSVGNHSGFTYKNERPGILREFLVILNAESKHPYTASNVFLTFDKQFYFLRGFLKNLLSFFKLVFDNHCHVHVAAITISALLGISLLSFLS